MPTKLSYRTLSQLSLLQVEKYHKAISQAFPEVILRSAVTAEYWTRVEKYFPDMQLFILDEEGEIIGFMNTVSFYWDQPFSELPEEGWDWMLEKGVNDYESNIEPNCIGGLQIIVTKNNLGKGYSKLLIEAGKSMKDRFNIKNLIIPIRPTYKSQHPEVEMEEYMSLQKDGKVYDPWIRTHLNSGAQIVKICHNSMNIQGDLDFWQELTPEKLTTSGKHRIEGALNLVDINIDQNFGEYQEDNIWISYV